MEESGTAWLVRAYKATTLRSVLILVCQLSEIPLQEIVLLVHRTESTDGKLLNVITVANV